MNSPRVYNSHKCKRSKMSVNQLFQVSSAIFPLIHTHTHKHTYLCMYTTQKFSLGLKSILLLFSNDFSNTVIFKNDTQLVLCSISCLILNIALKDCHWINWDVLI